MKQLLCIFITIIFIKPVFGQFITIDSSTTNFKTFEGKINTNRCETGYCNFKGVISKYNNFIEISTIQWKSIIVKYRLEKNPTFKKFSITKTMNQIDCINKMSSYIAIDSSFTYFLKENKKSFDYLVEKKVYRELHAQELEIFSFFLRLIIELKLQRDFLDYNPKSFTGWLNFN